MSNRSVTIPAATRGYTAVELLVTIAILIIVTAVAVPGFRDFVQNNRAAADSNALVTAFHLARNEAVTRAQPITICASANGTSCGGSVNWTSGWLVFTDANAPTGTVNGTDRILRVFPAVSQDSLLMGNATAVTYRPNGFLNGAAVVNFSLTVPDCTGDNNRAISINLQGRAALSHTACI